MRYLHWISKRWPRSTGVAQRHQLYWLEVAGNCHKDWDRRGMMRMQMFFKGGRCWWRNCPQVCWLVVIAGWWSIGCIRQDASCGNTQYEVIIIFRIPVGLLENRFVRTTNPTTFLGHMASRELYMSTRSSGHQTGFQAARRWKKPAVLWATIGHEFMSQRLVAVIILWSKSGHGAEEEQYNFQSFEDETIPLLLRWIWWELLCWIFHQDILDMIWHTKRTYRHDFVHSSEHHFVHRRSDGVSPTLFGLRQHHGITSWTSEGNFWSPQDVRLSMTRIGRDHQEKRQCCNEFIRKITKWGMIFLNKQPSDKTTPSIRVYHQIC